MSLTHRFIACAMLILLAGFSFRLGLSGFFSLDGDDIASIRVARHDPSGIVNGLLAMQLDIHPPLHFLALKAWEGLTGEALLALRAMNAFVELITGAALIRLVSRAFGRRAGLIAGVLWTFAPALVFSAYKIRMYTLLTAFATLALLCLIEAQLHNGGRRYLGYGLAALCGLAAVYTHSLGVIVFGGLILALVVINVRNWRERAVGLACFFIAGILTLPYLIPLWNYYHAKGSQVTRQWSDSLFSNIVNVPGSIIATLVTNRLLIERAAILALVPLFIVLSFWVWRKFGKRSLPLLIVFWFSAIALVGLAWFAHIYKTFYLSAFAPPALALVAGSLASGRKSIVQSSLLLAVVVLSLTATIHDLDYSARDDTTAATLFVQQHERPGDLVLVVPDWAADQFQYHFQGKAPVVGAFPGVSRDMDLDSLLPFVTKGYSGVWVVRFQAPFADPDDLLDSWFNQHAFFVTAVYPSKISLSYYDLQPERDSPPDYAHPLDVQFGDVAALRGVYLPVQEGGARDTRLHPPSDWVQVILYWESLKAGANFRPRVRLTDPYGQVYGGELYTDLDTTLLHRAPVTTWKPGQLWEVISMLNLNPDTPPGRYNIEVMVFDGATGERLPASGKDAGEAWALPGQFTIH